MLSRWKQNSLFLFVLFEVHMSDMTQTFFNIYPYESPDLSMLRGFDNKCLRRILQIYWPNVISNNDLEDCTGGWGGGCSQVFGAGMLVIPLTGKNPRIWYRLGCHRRNFGIFAYGAYKQRHKIAYRQFKLM